MGFSCTLREPDRRKNPVGIPLLDRSPTMEKTPGSLLERLREGGSQESWDTFVRLFTPMIYGWARRVGLEADGAADLDEVKGRSRITKY